MKQCRFCAESIQDAAIKCRFCGEMVVAVDYSDEQVVVEKNPAWRSYTKLLILSALLMVIGVGFFIFLYVLFHRMGKTYIMTTSRIIVKQGVFSKKIDEINIRDIRNMVMKQSFLDRIFDCGDIYIGTSGTAENEIVIKGIKAPLNFKEDVAKYRSRIVIKK